jgi:AraC-like DNA-binding protein
LAKEMPASVTSVFSEPDDFQAALRADGVLRLLITGHGQFRARLTQVTLQHLRLSAGDEQLSRIAFVAVPADMILVVLPISDRPAPIWDGIAMQGGEVLTFGPGVRIHARTEGPCRWGAIRSPSEYLAQYGRALSETDLVLRPAARWRPPRAALRQLRHLHQAAVHRVEARSEVLADAETAHGLEQQLIHALVECLANGSAIEAPPATIEHRNVAARFEALLQARLEPCLRIAEICKLLGVSAPALRAACQEQLGMGPLAYIRCRSHQAKRQSDADP